MEAWKLWATGTASGKEAHPMTTSSKIGRGFSCLLILVAGVFTIAPTPCNLSIAEYPGSSEKAGREGTSDVFAVDHEIVQPIDASTGQATGVRQHRAFTVLKKIDKATPGLHKALGSGQLLKEPIIDFYRIDPATGEVVMYYTVLLKNVRVIGVKTMMPTSFLPENEAYGHMEEIRLVYETIEWRWLPDSVVEMDKWRLGNAASLAVPSAAGLDSSSTGSSSPAGSSSGTPSAR